MSSRRLPAAVGLLPALAALLVPFAARAEEAPPRTVRVAEVGTADVVDEIQLVGDLEGIQEVRVVAQVPERIRTLTVREGDVVRKGELLATLWGESQTQGVNQSQAGLEAAVAQRDQAADNLKRIRSLAQVGSVPPAQLEAAEAQARAAEAQVRQAAAGLGQASVQKDRTTVRSPLAGVVAQIFMREGDVAQPGSPILTVVRKDRVKAVLRVPERHFLRIQEGMTVRVSALARPEEVTEGVVTLRGPVVDRATRTGLVEIHLENEDGRLVPGSAIRVDIELGRQVGVVVVPASAVLLSTRTGRTGEAEVFVAEGEVARRREIRVGRRQGDRIQVLEGLAAGEQLIVQGAHLLRDGSPIEIARAKPAPGEAEK